VTGYAGQIVTLRVDLNRLRGNRIATRRDFVVGGGGKVPDLRPGEVIGVMEEEGDTYLATVEHVDGSLVYLWLDLESWTPAVEAASTVHSTTFSTMVPATA
jgi:hypothetical protein